MSTICFAVFRRVFVSPGALLDQRSYGELSSPHPHPAASSGQ
jgi:hypothetical protein